jgi:hypothetical protein
MTRMKLKIVARLLVLSALVAALTGCYSTETERTKAGVPFIKDKFVGQYERPVDQVFQAAKDVCKDMGQLNKEGTMYENGVAIKTIEATINECHVWMRIEPIDKITAVTVQARTKGGGSNMDLVHEVEKEIALKLK